MTGRRDEQASGQIMQDARGSVDYRQLVLAPASDFKRGKLRIRIKLLDLYMYVSVNIDDKVEQALGHFEILRIGTCKNACQCFAKIAEQHIGRQARADRQRTQ